MSKLSEMEAQRLALLDERNTIFGKIRHIDSILERRSVYGTERSSALKKQDAHRNKVTIINAQLLKLNHEIDMESRREAEARIELLAESGSKNMDFRGLKEIRDKYLSFAEDSSRVNSMRILAAQIAKDLSDFLEGYTK